jgi:hypothetical protein
MVPVADARERRPGVVGRQETPMKRAATRTRAAYAIISEMQVLNHLFF